MSISKNIGKRLKIARQVAGYKTAKAFYEHFSIPKTTYSQHESGLTCPSADLLIFYSNILEIDVTWLLTGRGHPCPNAVDAKNRKALITLAVHELQEKGELPLVTSQPINADSDYALVDVGLLKKILVQAIDIIPNNQHSIDSNEMLEFCLNVYNNIEPLRIDNNEKDKIIALSIASMLTGRKPNRTDHTNSSISSRKG